MPLGLALLAALAVASLALVLVAEAVDRPSTTIRHEAVVRAPRALVWRLLTDLEGYRDWNPYVTRASGETVRGARIQLHMEPVRTTPRDTGCDVITVKEPRKLYWRCRDLGPGVLDREHTFRLIPLGDDRLLLTYEGRWEGVLVPVVDLDDRKQGYVRMVDALVAYAERTALNPGGGEADE